MLRNFSLYFKFKLRGNFSHSYSFNMTENRRKTCGFKLHLKTLRCNAFLSNHTKNEKSGTWMEGRVTLLRLQCRKSKSNKRGQGEQQILLVPYQVSIFISLPSRHSEICKINTVIRSCKRWSKKGAKALNKLIETYFHTCFYD